MHLLVSAATVDDALAALAGGADIVDAKDPRAGALGAVAIDTLRAIGRAIGQARPLSAALGDAIDPDGVGRAVRAAAGAGARFVKLGFAGHLVEARIAALLTTAVRAAGGARVIAVAYADAGVPEAPPRELVLAAAAAAGAAGVLLDTLHKEGPGLVDLLPPDALRRWIASVHAASLIVALAGRLRPADLAALRALGADIAGVRGAACIGGRAGPISAERVRRLTTFARGSRADKRAERAELAGADDPPAYAAR